MPITEDIMNHDVIGPTAKKGALEVPRPLMEERFRPIPAWAVVESSISYVIISLNDQPCTEPPCTAVGGGMATDEGCCRSALFPS
jgi:hypothetical protein